jgi:hypothetical protein
MIQEFEITLSSDTTKKDGCTDIQSPQEVSENMFKVPEPITFYDKPINREFLPQNTSISNAGYVLTNTRKCTRVPTYHRPDKSHQETKSSKNKGGGLKPKLKTTLTKKTEVFDRFMLGHEKYESLLASTKTT